MLISERFDELPCTCGEVMCQVIGFDEGKRIRVGWYCITCTSFVKTIGRERQVTDDDFRRRRKNDSFTL